jgi:5-methylthioribose kinase
MNDLKPSEYRVLRGDEIVQLLAREPSLHELLGGDCSTWRVRDVADGNINAVYLVDGAAGGVCVKQALPWLRVAGDSWPLPIERAVFEDAYMRRIEPIVGALAPRWLHFDPVMHVIVMERLEPHVILRQGLIKGRVFPDAARAVADYVAAACFHTSDLANGFERKYEDLALFSRNVALQRITLDLVFTEPYIEAARNHWVEPWLDGWAASLRNDLALKTVVARHRLHYLTHAQALIHGDLHSGSVMVTERDTRVIDGEFAALGPIGFDLGAFIGNLLLAWYSKAGDAVVPSGSTYRQWILDQAVVFWQRFDQQFRSHWSGHVASNDAYPPSHFASAAGQARLALIQRDYVARIFDDMLAYAAIKMIRRIVGFAQVADFLAIEDLRKRALAQAGALALARDLLLHPHRFPGIAALVDAAPRYECVGLDPDLSRRA